MRHIPALARCKRAKVNAICNPFDSSLAFYAAEKNIPGVFQNIDAFLQTDIDAVVICTPPKTHAELIEKALQAGKHVLCEKPFTMHEEDGQRLEKLAQEKNLVLCASHNFQFSRSVRKAKECIASGKLGNVIGASGYQWSSAKRPLPTWYPDLPGKLFFDESPHLIYMLQSFVGDLEVEDAWRNERGQGEDSFEQFEIRLKGEKGYATISALFGTPVSEWFMVVYGTKGAVVLDIFRDVAAFIPPEKSRDPKYLLASIANVDRQIWGGMAQWIISRFTKGGHLFGLEELTSGFVTAALDGTPPPIPTDEGWKVVKVINDSLRTSGVLTEEHHAE